MATAFILHSSQMDQWCSAKAASEAAISDNRLRQVTSKISWNGFRWSRQPSEHKRSREGS